MTGELSGLALSAEARVGSAAAELEVLATRQARAMTTAGRAIFNAVNLRLKASHIESLVFHGIEVEGVDDLTRSIEDIYTTAKQKAGKTSSIAIDLAFRRAGIFHEMADTCEDNAIEQEQRIRNGSS